MLCRTLTFITATATNVILDEDLTEWEEYIKDKSLRGDPAIDKDKDGESDLLEFALKGDAKDDSVSALRPSILKHRRRVSFFHQMRTSANSGVEYIPEWSENLIDWNRNWNSTRTKTSTENGFIIMENRLKNDSPARNELYFRLKVVPK